MACAACVMSLSAQRASDSALSASDIKDYNRIGISYNNTHYGFNDAYGKNHSDLNFGLNGIGIDYIHGFSVSSSLPLYIETGLNLDFNFGSKKGDKEEAAGYWFQDKRNYSDINMQVPVNVAWKFAAGEDFSIAPYLGLNFKVHFSSRFKDKIDTNVPEDILSQIGYSKSDLEGDWISVFDSAEDAMDGDDETWNRFQMGWHVGVGFQYKPIYLGVQYGTDFIPAYSHKYTYDGESETYKVSTGNLKVTLGYVF